MRLILIYLTVVVLHVYNFTFLIKIAGDRDLPKIQVSCDLKCWSYKTVS